MTPFFTEGDQNFTILQLRNLQTTLRTILIHPDTYMHMCIHLYMYISLKIDKSQWCKKAYQVIAYSLIKKVSLQRNIDI